MIRKIILCRIAFAAGRSLLRILKAELIVSGCLETLVINGLRIAPEQGTALRIRASRLGRRRRRFGRCGFVPGFRQDFR